MSNKTQYIKYVFGDLNSRHPNWNSIPENHNSKGIILNDFLINKNFKIINNDRRITFLYELRNVEMNSKLDLILTNDDDDIEKFVCFYMSICPILIYLRLEE